MKNAFAVTQNFSIALIRLGSYESIIMFIELLFIFLDVGVAILKSDV